MEIKPLLPKLKQDANLAISKRGEWISGKQNTLQALVDSLDVSSNNESTINSIPDVWARPIIYSQILFDPDHPLHRKYVGEWRGILAVLALRKEHPCEGIDTHYVTVPTKEKITGYIPDFLKVVSSSLPDEFIHLSNDRTFTNSDAIKAKVYLLSYAFDGKESNRRPLAIIWPEILICPSADLGLKANQKTNISWWDEKGFNDPIKYLSADEKVLLASWLDRVKNHIIDRKMKNDPLLIVLEKYIRDLDVEKGYNLKFENTLNITGFCDFLGEAVEVDNSDATAESILANSNIKLITKDSYKGKKQYVVISEDINEQLQSDSSSIRSYGSKTIANLLASYNLIRLGKYKDETLVSLGIDVRTAESFLTEAIGVISMDTDAFPNVMARIRTRYNNRDVNIIPPLKREILDLLTTKDIINNLSVKVKDHEIYVEFKLPISGMSDKKNFLIARRTYKKDPTGFEGYIREYNQVPLLQVWPNFRLSEANRWKLYYTYYDPVNNDTFYAKPVWKEDNMRNIERDLINAEIRRGYYFPEAFACYEKQSDVITKEEYLGLFRKDEDRIEIGILMLSLPKVTTLNNVGKKFNIGIDFGTTNSVAYMSTGIGEDASLVEIHNRMFYVCHNEDSDSLVDKSMLDNLRVNFLSTVVQPTKFDPKSKEYDRDIFSISTLFHKYHGSERGDLETPLFRGNIYYLDNYDNVYNNDDFSNNHIKGVDLKWGEKASSEYRQSFLGQLAMQCMAEAVVSGATSIEFNYSYPQSFSVNELRSYKNDWKIVKEQLEKITDNNIEINNAKTESLCLAKYFVNDMDATPNSGIVCLDIGGGSTDLIVLQGTGDILKYQTSLKFAGGAILGDYLFNRMRKTGRRCPLESLKIEGQDGYNEMINSISDEDRNKDIFSIRLETLLKYFERQILKAIANDAKNEDIKYMLRDIAFSVTGIVFYTGFIIGYIYKMGMYKNLNSLPACYFGGNGSKLLNWIGYGDFNDELVTKLFSECFKAGIQAVDDDIEFGKHESFRMTRKPKQEVAYGLVVNDTTNFDNFSNKDISSYIAAEKFVVADNKPNNEYIITASDILDHVQLDSDDLPIFTRFVDVFNKEIKTYGLDPIQFSEDDFHKIVADVNQKLSDIRAEYNGNIEEVKSEPLFIMVLRYAVDCISGK